MSSFSVEVEVVCGACGAGLEVELNSRGVLEVSACSKCVEEAKDQGHEDGYREAWNEAEAAEAAEGKGAP